MEQDKKVISKRKERIVSGKITSLVQTKKFQTDWYKIPLLGEAEIAIRWGIMFWWGFVEVTPFGACFFLALSGRKSTCSGSFRTHFIALLQNLSWLLGKQCNKSQETDKVGQNEKYN